MPRDACRSLLRRPLNHEHRSFAQDKPRDLSGAEGRAWRIRTRLRWICRRSQIQKCVNWGKPLPLGCWRPRFRSRHQQPSHHGRAYPGRRLGRYPRAVQICRIAWTKEFFAPMKDAVNMFMPTYTGAGAEGFRDPRNRSERAQGQFKCSWADMRDCLPSPA